MSMTLAQHCPTEPIPPPPSASPNLLLTYSPPQQGIQNQCNRVWSCKDWDSLPLATGRWLLPLLPPNLYRCVTGTFYHDWGLLPLRRCRPRVPHSLMLMLLGTLLYTPCSFTGTLKMGSDLVHSVRNLWLLWQSTSIFTWAKVHGDWGTVALILGVGLIPGPNSFYCNGPSLATGCGGQSSNLRSFSQLPQLLWLQ